MATENVEIELASFKMVIEFKMVGNDIQVHKVKKQGQEAEHRRTSTHSSAFPPIPFTLSAHCSSTKRTPSALASSWEARTMRYVFSPKRPYFS